MLTIKFIDPESNYEELVFTAEKFSVERRSDGFRQFLAFDDNRDDYKATWCGDVAGEFAGVFKKIIYVMNEQGATVATYRFHEPDFERGPSTQMPPSIAA